MGDSVTAIDLIARRLLQAFAIVVLAVALYQRLSSVLATSMLFLFVPDFDLGRLGSALTAIEGPFAGALDWLKAHLPEVIVAYLGLVLATLLTIDRVALEDAGFLSGVRARTGIGPRDPLYEFAPAPNTDLRVGTDVPLPGAPYPPDRARNNGPPGIR
jgi:hypothetical protein